MFGLSVLVLCAVFLMCTLDAVKQSAMATNTLVQMEQSVVVNTGEAELPELYITLTQDEVLSEKEYSDAQMTLVYPESMLPEQQAIDAEALSIQVRYRGNSTYEYDKKPFKIKLEEEADLLRASTDANSEGTANDWILLADWVDRTHLHNYYMCLVGGQLDGLEFVPEGIFVEVYFEGEYQGVYFLCEEVEVDLARLNVQDSDAIENAVLMEMTHTATQEYYFEVEYQDRTVVYDIHSEIVLDEQVLRAQQCVTDALAALATGEQETIAAAIDLDSCVDMYLLQEFMMNVDVGYSSFYL